MGKQIYVAQFTNGIDRRSTTVFEPDITFAATAAQQLATDVFRRRWNKVPDQSKWKIVIISPDHKRYEEPTRIN
jgi:hypothetical protein